MKDSSSPTLKARQKPTPYITWNLRRWQVGLEAGIMQPLWVKIALLKLSNQTSLCDFRSPLPHFLLALGQLKYLTLTDPEKVWKPDTFFRNEKTGHFHSILVNNVYVRIFPNGDVLFSIRSAENIDWVHHDKSGSARLPHPQNIINSGLPHELEALSNGPSDLRTQNSELWVKGTCPPRAHFWPSLTCFNPTSVDGYTTDDITYLWKQTDPVQIAKGLNLPRFSIEKYSNSYCNVKTNTGNSLPYVQVYIL